MGEPCIDIYGPDGWGIKITKRTPVDTSKDLPTEVVEIWDVPASKKRLKDE